MSKSLIRLSEVQRRTGFSKAWLYRLMSEKRFPSPIKIGSRSVAFIESEKDVWIEERINASRSDTQFLNADKTRHIGSANARKSASTSKRK